MIVDSLYSLQKWRVAVNFFYNVFKSLEIFRKTGADMVTVRIGRVIDNAGI